MLSAVGTAEAGSAVQFRCPKCKKKVARAAKDFPFCSERCKMNDLGAWASGDYAIAGDPAYMPDDADHEF